MLNKNKCNMPACLICTNIVVLGFDIISYIYNFSGKLY